MNASDARATGPDVAFVGGRIVTVDSQFRIAEALRIDAGRIRAVGTAEQVRADCGGGTRIVDLEGRTVVPGFVDTHGHIALFGLDELKVQLAGALDREAIVARIADAARRAAPGDWLVTVPIGTAPYFLDFEALRAAGQVPTRAELDRAAPGNPVYITAPTNRVPNSAVLNSAALARAGIDRHTVTDAPIELVRDARGELTGELRGAMQPIYNPWPFYQRIAAVIPPVTYRDIREGIRVLGPKFAANGTTTLLEAHLTQPEELRAYAELLEQDALPLRIFFTFEIDGSQPLDAIDHYLRTVRFAAGSGFGTARLKVVGVSVGLDGPYWHGAACNDRPYPGPYGDTVHPGTLVDPEKYRAIVRLAVAHGFRLHTECAGRGSIELAVSTLGGPGVREAIRDRRFVLEHVEFPTREQIAQCRALGLAPTTSTNFIWGKGAEVYTDRLGREYADRAIPLRDWLDAGVPIAQSTDWGPREPLFTLWQSLARRAGLTGRTIGPEQAISREEALRIFTRNGAWALCMEDRLGSLVPGACADLVVLDGDPLTCELDAIRHLRVQATLLDGRLVYCAPGWTPGL